MINTNCNYLPAPRRQPAPLDQVQIELQGLVTDVALIQQQFGQVGSRLEAGDRSLEPAQQDLLSTQFPLMRAERDDANHDVSADGRELGQLLNHVASELNHASPIMLEVEQSSRDLGQTLLGVQKRIDKLGQAVTHEQVGAALKVAGLGLKSAAGNSDRVGQNVTLAYQQGSDAQLEVIASNPLTQIIANDKAGVDVSFQARLLEGRVGTIRYDVDDARHNLQDASRQQLQGRDQTDSAQRALQGALQLWIADH